MNIAILGHGEAEIKLCELFQQKLQSDKIVCFIESNVNNIRDFDKIPVVSIGSLRLLIPPAFSRYVDLRLPVQGLIDKIIFLGYDAATYRELMKVFVYLGLDYRNLLFNAEYNWFIEKLNGNIKTFFELIEESHKQMPLISALEYELVKNVILIVRGVIITQTYFLMVNSLILIHSVKILIL